MPLRASPKIDKTALKPGGPQTKNGEEVVFPIDCTLAIEYRGDLKDFSIPVLPFTDEELGIQQCIIRDLKNAM